MKEYLASVLGGSAAVPGQEDKFRRCSARKKLRHLEKVQVVLPLLLLLEPTELLERLLGHCRRLGSCSGLIERRPWSHDARLGALPLRVSERHRAELVPREHLAEAALLLESALQLLGLPRHLANSAESLRGQGRDRTHAQRSFGDGLDGQLLELGKVGHKLGRLWSDHQLGRENARLGLGTENPDLLVFGR